MKGHLIAIIAYLRNLLSKIFKRYNKRLPYIITSAITGIIVIGAISLFDELTENLKDKYLVSYDTRISEAVMRYRSPVLTEYFIFITNFGDTWGYVVAFVVCTLLFYWKFKNGKYVSELALVMILALSSDFILKKVINRTRPGIEHLVKVDTASYPSGHAMISMAFYGFLIYLIYNFKISMPLKVFLIAFCAFLILNIGISRIYLGVHFPSDIAGGYIAGFIWVIFCIMVFNLIKIFRKESNIK